MQLNTPMSYLDSNNKVINLHSRIVSPYATSLHYATELFRYDTVIPEDTPKEDGSHSKRSLRERFLSLRNSTIDVFN